jgi:hypothetical protein
MKVCKTETVRELKGKVKNSAGVDEVRTSPPCCLLIVILIDCGAAQGMQRLIFMGTVMQDMQTMEECNLKEDGMCIHLFERKCRDDGPRAEASGQFQPVSSSTTNTELRVAQIRVETVDAGALDYRIQIQRRTIRVWSALIVSGPYQKTNVTTFYDEAHFLPSHCSIPFERSFCYIRCNSWFYS